MVPAFMIDDDVVLNTFIKIRVGTIITYKYIRIYF